MIFRCVQAMSVSTVLIMWIARSVSHHGWHPMLLTMAALLAVSTEVSYRAGTRDARRAEIDKKRSA